MKKALIVYGGWPGHEPEKCTEIIKGMLEPEGYEVRAEYQTSVFADCLLYTSPSPRDGTKSRMPSSA